MVGESKGGPNRREEKILVSVRLRPLNDKELAKNDGCDWECIGDDTIAINTTLPNAYTFDRVFGHECQTKKVYEEGAKEIILSVVCGINSTVFAYGQTSSGKTYTMNGITEFAVGDIYNYVDTHKRSREFVLRFSAMEIYNEAVRDLLGATADSASLRLLDDPEKGTVVERLTEQVLRDRDHLMELLSVCAAQRKMGETSLNETSSRSHQILRLTVESSSREFKGVGSSSILAATVNFVDLAGSERASQTMSTGARLKEGSHINRSLLTLGTVIRKLSKGETGHVPYRDSKLTRILQSSLGGNARTAIICTLSPARSQIEQSRNALLFASCAKEVTTSAKINVVVSDKTLVKQLKSELARMETELRRLAPRPHASHDSSELLKEKELIIEKMGREIKELRRQRDRAESRIESMLRSKSTSMIRIDQQQQLEEEEEAEEEENDMVSESSVVVAEESGCDYEGLKAKIKEMQKTIDCLVNNYPQEGSPNSSEAMGVLSSQGLPLSRSRSCRAVITTHENNASSARSEMESPGSVQSFWWKTPQTNRGNVSGKDSCSSTMSISFEPDTEAETSSAKGHGISIRKLLRNDSRASVSSSTREIDVGNGSEDLFGEQKGLLRLKLFKEKFGANNTEKFDSDENLSVFSFNTKLNQLAKDNQEQETESEKHTGEMERGVLQIDLSWPVEFERRRQEIIELWDSCRVPLVHRTYFFLLFKGEPSDSVYYEVELRRLSFLRETFSIGATQASSLKMLNREREMLSKQVRKKFARKDRERLYQKWSVALSTKQRSLQLARRLWSNTRDLEHLMESAVLVAKLVGFVEAGQVRKETFGISFTPQTPTRKPFVWKHSLSSLS